MAQMHATFEMNRSHNCLIRSRAERSGNVIRLEECYLFEPLCYRGEVRILFITRLMGFKKDSERFRK